ncbi:MurR/RpiR family transcriptional regulator [Sorangium sp. So ce1153]|uniref:MurR/RpiR family transcriptional regulator n=1 Tax=Sorangium sp. So ce1153 TaxID=3133333 RepID=UPI003F62EEA2
MRKSKAAYPETYDQLERAIIERFPSLSKRLQQIASHALDNPSELALDTIAQVSQRAGVQPSSLIRFAKVFGFSGYSDMQRVFRMRVTDAMPDYKERLRSLNGAAGAPSEEAEGGASALLDQFVEADIVGLRRLQQHKRMGRLLDRAYELITDSEIVYVVAHRRSFPIACYLAYALSQMNVRNVLVDGVGGMFMQQVGHATNRDVIIAISSKAYSPDVAQVVGEAKRRGVKIIAMTDSPLSPLAEHADVSMEVQQASVGMFRSLAVTMTLAVTLIVGLGRAVEAKRGHGNGRKSKRSP